MSEKEEGAIFWKSGLYESSRSSKLRFFWDDRDGDNFIRRSLVDYIGKLTSEGFNVIGIKIPSDRHDRKIELILERNQKFKDTYETN